MARDIYFDGKRYRHYNTYKTKGEALKAAERLRKAGLLNARVHRSPYSPTEYYVYMREK